LHAAGVLGAGIFAGQVGFPGILRSARAAAPEIKTVNPGFLTMSMTDYLPMIAIRDGKVVGVDGDLAALIAERVGLKVKGELMAATSTFQSVASGRVDCYGGNLYWTKKRAEVALLTDTVYYPGMFAIMKTDKAFTTSITTDDFAAHSIGSATMFGFVPDMKKIPGTTEVKLYDTPETCLMDVVAGRLDFAFLDAPIIDYMIQQNPDWGLKQVRITFNPDYPGLTSKAQCAWAVNPQELDLFDALNQGIAWLKRTNQISAMLAKYGIKDSDYVQPLPEDARIGVDRDENGKLIGPFAHEQKDFSEFFAT
jgi:ABC-type amino acid transport substrate-binding protein